MTDAHICGRMGVGGEWRGVSSAFGGVCGLGLALTPGMSGSLSVYDALVLSCYIHSFTPLGSLAVARVMSTWLAGWLAGWMDGWMAA